MNQIIRYVLPTILIVVGMVMVWGTNVRFSHENSIGKDLRGIGSIVLSRCKHSFENNPSFFNLPHWRLGEHRYSNFRSNEAPEVSAEATIS